MPLLYFKHAICTIQKTVKKKPQAGKKQNKTKTHVHDQCKHPKVMYATQTFEDAMQKSYNLTQHKETLLLYELFSSVKAAEIIFHLLKINPHKQSVTRATKQHQENTDDINKPKSPLSSSIFH